MKILTYFVLLVMALMLLLFSVIACAQQGKKEKKSAKKTANKIERVSSGQSLFVMETLDSGIITVKQVIIDLFASAQKHQQKKFDNFDVFNKQSEGFPNDTRLRDYSQENNSLAKYISISQSAKENDLYLCDVLHQFWESTEYTCNGRPAKFQTNFIVHLEPKGPKQTLIEIIQFQPNVWCGQEYYAGHHGLGWYNNTKWVSPTVKDSQELLEMIVGSVKNIQHR